MEQQQLASIKERGALEIFQELPDGAQRAYAEVSLMELAAFTCWHNLRRANHKEKVPDAILQSDWDLLDCDEKADCVPEDARAILAADGRWASLLADGPPPCSEHSEQNRARRSTPPDSLVDEATSSQPDADGSSVAAREALVRLFGSGSDGAKATVAGVDGVASEDKGASRRPHANPPSGKRQHKSARKAAVVGRPQSIRRNAPVWFSTAFFQGSKSTFALPRFGD